MNENRLASERSAYLRDAAHQPVHWYPWGEEAFARARQEDKPIVLDIGAVWCHWCHVIDHESYEDPEVAAIINEHFIAVKVDRDERPDIDARYQQAVSALSGQGGWPLTAFLTPDGKVFFGGTYFPPTDAYGRPGFKRILLGVAQHYRENKTEAVETAARLHQQLAALAAGAAYGELHAGLLATAVQSIRQRFDLTHGGFGSAPKFPHTSAVEFLLRRYHRTRDDELLAMVTRTLEKMGRGGIHDQIGGGFHRYSTDAGWIVPHFEKMLYDNAGLLTNYVHGYQASGNPYLKEVAGDTAEFIATVLYDDQRGGFFGSQDADVSPTDDGGYFTWSEDETRGVLTSDEFAVLAEHYHLQGRGEMHTEPTRHVLFIHRDPDVIAAVLRKDPQEVQDLVASARRTLTDARTRRPAPYVDTALYASWNGMAISAFFEAYKVLGVERCRRLALRALDRFLTQGYDPANGFMHVLDGSVSPRLLDDQAQMAQALLDAYEVTGETRYLLTARETVDVMLRAYWDDPTFLDVPRETPDPLLATPHRPVQDAPTPAPNAVAALVLLRLSRMFNADSYRSIAQRLVQAVAPSLAPHALFASALMTALDDLLHEPAHVTIVGAPDDPRTAALHAAALRTYRPDKIISLHPPHDVLHPVGPEQVPLPDAVRAMLTAADVPKAYVCAGTACARPTSDPEALAQTIATFGLS